MRRNNVTPAIAALAGRRIDEQNAEASRFPLTEVNYVFHKILRRFRQENIGHLVCSAACGADILALKAAKELGIPSTVVLPFIPEIFRNISVADRPGNWGSWYDHLIEDARDRGELVELGFATNNKNAFAETNRRIISLAQESRFRRKLAFVVWEGLSRGMDDVTAEFLRMALAQEFEKKTVLTKRRGP